MDEGEWRPIPGWPGYEVTIDRRVRRVTDRNGRPQAPRELKTFRSSAVLTSGGRSRTVSRRVLVALAWGEAAAGPPPPRGRPPIDWTRRADPASAAPPPPQPRLAPAGAEADPEVPRLAAAWWDARRALLGRRHADHVALLEEAADRAEAELADRLVSEHGGSYTTQHYRRYEVGPTGRVEASGVPSGASSAGIRREEAARVG